MPLNYPPGRRSGGSAQKSPAGMIVAFILAAIAFIFAVLFIQKPSTIVVVGDDGDTTIIPTTYEDGLTQVKSKADFVKWLESVENEGLSYFTGADRTFRTDAVFAPLVLESQANGVGGGILKAERVSETNVQVSGIDEPDILKTDGKELFFSGRVIRNYRQTLFEDAIDDIAVSPLLPTKPAIELDEEDSARSDAEPAFIGRLFAPEYYKPVLRVVNAFPPEDLKLDAEIEESGEMLLHDGTLAVFAYDGIHAYDVNDPTAPEKTWSVTYENNTQLVSARLSGDTIYAIMRAGTDKSSPCPVTPLLHGDTKITVPCGDIWHPIRPVPADATYTIVALDMKTGKKKQATSFVGSWNDTTVYMSNKNIYVTYGIPLDILSFTELFVSENTKVFPASVRDRLKKLIALDISSQAKQVEMNIIFEDWMSTMDKDDRLKLNNDLTDIAKAFLKKHLREMQRTGIVRFEAKTLKMRADGQVAGALINQFAMDEYEGHLRVATTTGGRNSGIQWRFRFGSGVESVNDIYVLDKDMKRVGSVKDLGVTERIYSVRFVGDEGYVVTFRETDPFYVLDLSKPKAPKMVGELKIPGFSSYLHPISDDIILGIGKEDRQVKLSLFDVSDPTNPLEVDKYTLDEYWSDVLNTHHAFLMDAEKEIFFMPGGQGGYIFSYADNEIELTKAVSEIRARRAIYLDDYFYVVGDDGIVVLDQTDWERVAELDF